MSYRPRSSGPHGSEAGSAWFPRVGPARTGESCLLLLVGIDFFLCRCFIIVETRVLQNLVQNRLSPNGSCSRFQREREQRRSLSHDHLTPFGT